MRIMDCFPSNFQRVIGDATFFFSFLHAILYFIVTKLRVGVVFLKSDSIGLTSTPFKKKKKSQVEMQKIPYNMLEVLN